MSKVFYVTEGAKVKCTMGFMNPKELKGTSHGVFRMNGNTALPANPALITEIEANAETVGTCKCRPLFPAPWINGATQTITGDFATLTSDCMIVCAKGFGVVSIVGEAEFRGSGKSISYIDEVLLPGVSHPILVYTNGYAQVNKGKIDIYIRGKVKEPDNFLGLKKNVMRELVDS